MTTKTQLRDEFYAAILPVVKQELPGIRGDLHRKISRDIAAKLSGRVLAVYEDNLRLTKTERDLTAKLDAALRKRPGVSDIDRAINALEQAKGKINGEAQN